MRGDADAVARFRSAPPEQREAVGREIARQLELANPDRLAEFVRAIVREDATAIRRRGYLPEPIRRAVDELAEVRRFRNNARTDASFTAFMGSESAPGQGRARVVEATQAIERALAQMAPGAGRGAVPDSVALAGSLNLNEAEGVSRFVRLLSGGNEAARAQFEQLPRQMRGQIEAFLRNSDFIRDPVKVAGAAARIGQAMVDLEVAAIRLPEIVPGSILDRAGREGGMRAEQLNRVEFHNRRISEAQTDQGRVIFIDQQNPNTRYIAVDSDRGLYWAAYDVRFPGREPRTLPSRGNAELLFVLNDRYGRYSESLYSRQVEAEFGAQTRFTDIAAFRTHLESTIPADFLNGFDRLSGTGNMEGFIRGLTAAMTAHPDVRLSMAQVQLLMNRHSQRLGLGIVDVSAMFVQAGEARVPLTELAQSVHLATEGMLAAHGNRARVYLWRDAGGFMAVDALLSAGRGGRQPQGALINRVAFGQGAAGRQQGQRVDPAAAMRVFDSTVRTAVEGAGEFARAAPGQGDRYSVFMQNLRERVSQMRAQDPTFDSACTQLLEYMGRSGIINPQADVVFDGVLVDSGSRTLLPFMQALLQNEYGSRVRVDIMYFNVAPGFEFLPNLGMDPRVYDAVESAGANNTFVLNNQDYSNVEMHGARRTRDSLAYFLLLRQAATRGRE